MGSENCCPPWTTHAASLQSRVGLGELLFQPIRYSRSSFLEMSDTGKTLSSRITESHIDLLSLGVPLTDSQPQNWIYRSILGRFQMMVYLESIDRVIELQGVTI